MSKVTVILPPAAPSPKEEAVPKASPAETFLALKRRVDAGEKGLDAALVAAKQAARAKR